MDHTMMILGLAKCLHRAIAESEAGMIDTERRKMVDRGEPMPSSHSDLALHLIQNDHTLKMIHAAASGLDAAVYALWAIASPEQREQLQRVERFPMEAVIRLLEMADRMRSTFIAYQQAFGARDTQIAHAAWKDATVAFERAYRERLEATSRLRDEVYLR